jgi:uncharacterized spore protein YtfJ
MATPETVATGTSEKIPGLRTQQSIRGILESAFDKGDVRRIYGEPVVRNGRTIVPIADVGSAFGFGSGSSGEPGKEGEGGGGGGKVTGKPIGYLEITDDGSCFKPVYDVTKIAIWGIAASAFVLWMMIRRK